MGAMLLGPALGAPTSGTVKLTATINDITTSIGTAHDCVVWVATGTGTFIKTLWKQGDNSFSASDGDWDHFNTWNNVRNGSTAFDGYTSATATSYAATTPSPPIIGIASNPIIATWNCLDANNNLVADGTYQFFIQYAEQGTAQGPVTAPALLNWTKGPNASSSPTVNQSPNFTKLSIVWTPEVPHPTIVVEQPAGTALVSGSGTVSFGSSPVGTAVPLTFTLKNSGTANLTGIAVTKNGTNATDFTVTTSPATTVAAAGSTTFTVNFNPTAGGTRTAALQIASNDTTRNPFIINLSGTGTAPVIAVEQPAGTSLVSGTGTTNFGSKVVGTPTPLTFTIKNTGNADLTDIDLTTDGTNAADFTVTPPTVTTVSAGASTTFTVTFNPLASGTSSAALHIASNDATRNPFNIALTGTGTIVAEPEIVVEQPAGTPLVDGSAKVKFANQVTGTEDQLTFTIRNIGAADLTNIAAATDGTNASEFTVTANPAATVAADGSTTFKVTFKPTGYGTRTAALHVASNDAARNPFDITLTGVGAADNTKPAIVVEQPTGTEISSGDTITYDTIRIHKRESLRFIISNESTGTGSSSNLRISKVTLTGPNASEFHTSHDPNKILKPGQVTSLKVQFAPKTEGAKEALLTITSNDPDDSPYQVQLLGKTYHYYDPDTYEDDDTPADASPIANGEIQTHSIDSSGDVDWAVFTLPNGASDVRIYTQDSKKKTRFTLYGPDSSTLVTAGRKGEFVGTFASLAAGTYSIKVRTKQRNDTVGTYTLTANWTENAAFAGLAKSAMPMVAGVVNVPAAEVPNIGLPLSFRQMIVDASPNDGIAKTADVLPLDDFDHDGINNLLEYALGGNPVRPDGAEARPLAVMTMLNGQPYPAMSFRRLKAPGTILYGVEESSNMTTWQALPLPWQLAGDPVDEGNGYERVTVPASVPMSAAGPRFLRVTVVGDP
jgi:hypothetical protein